MSLWMHVILMKSLLRDVCAEDEELFSAFLNRLFNTLSWTMTEFSVNIREMLEKNHVSLNCLMTANVLGLGPNLLIFTC